MNLYDPAQDPAYLFIDGDYFRRVVERYRRDVWKQDLAISLQSIAANYARVFFYDCSAPQMKNEEKEAYELRRTAQHKLHRDLGSSDKFHLVMGRIAGKGVRARQKGVDVRIAVDMLMFVQRECTRRLTLFSGDADFEPLVDALVQLGAQVTVLADRKSASKKLLAAADNKRFLDPDTMRTWMDSDAMPSMPSCDKVCGPPDAPARRIRSGTARQNIPVREFMISDVYIIRFGRPRASAIVDENAHYEWWSSMRGGDRDLLLRLLNEYVGEVAWDPSAT